MTIRNKSLLREYKFKLQNEEFRVVLKQNLVILKVAGGKKKKEKVAGGVELEAKQVRSPCGFHLARAVDCELRGVGVPSPAQKRPFLRSL